MCTSLYNCNWTCGCVHRLNNIQQIWLESCTVCIEKLKAMGQLGGSRINGQKPLWVDRTHAWKPVHSPQPLSSLVWPAARPPQRGVGEWQVGSGSQASSPPTKHRQDTDTTVEHNLPHSYTKCTQVLEPNSHVANSTQPKGMIHKLIYYNSNTNNSKVIWQK